MSAQPKPISEVVKDFEQSLENLRPRVYMAGARAAIKAAGLELWQCPSATELLASLGNSPHRKESTNLAFLGFLGGGEPKELVSDEDSAALQNWVIQRLAKQMRLVKNSSIATRRDSGLIAALCAAPARGTPRKWPENCLKIEGREVLLWDAAIEEPCFALPLRFWHMTTEDLLSPQIFAHSLASMGRFGCVTDFLLSLFVRVPERRPAARFFSSLQTVMPEREEPHFHVNESKARG